MAILKDGINGPFSGKVGNVVGYELNGQSIIRSLPSYTKRKPTALAQLNRNRMKAVSTFLRPIGHCIKFGYKDLAPPGSRVGTFQMAQSYIFKNALDYDSANENMPYVNPEKVLVFRGDELLPCQVHVTRDPEGVLFTYATNSKNLGAMHMVALIYDGEQFADFMTSGTEVQDGKYLWKTNYVVRHTKPFHVYVGFQNIFTGKLTDSIYCGCI